jgi:hypothetical protein
MKQLSLWIAILLVLGSPQVWGQGSQVAQISGTVKDSSDAAVPGAEVTATQTGTGMSRTVITSNDGTYVIPNLPVGPYKLQVTLQGFATYVQEGIVLQVNTNPTINPVLKVGSITDQVLVEANASMVETRITGVGQVIDQERVVELPLNGRQVSQLVTLSGGSQEFVPTSAGQSLVSNKNYPTVAAFSVAGGQGGQTLFLLDGSVNMDPMSNVGLPLPSRSSSSRPVHSRPIMEWRRVGWSTWSRNPEPTKSTGMPSSSSGITNSMRATFSLRRAMA